MRKRERSRANEMRAVEDQIEVDDARGVARCAATAEACLNGVQRVEQRSRREIGEAGDDGVQILRWRRINGIRLDERAHANDVNDLAQLVDGSAEEKRTVAD